MYWPKELQQEKKKKKNKNGNDIINDAIKWLVVKPPNMRPFIQGTSEGVLTTETSYFPYL